MWNREIDGLTLTFQLAGINNRNFLMRDEQTGTFWQQISGRALSGPLSGKQLRLVPADELTFGRWKSEQPQGRVLKGLARDAARYGDRQMEDLLREVPGELQAQGLEADEPVAGILLEGAALAWPEAKVRAQGLIRDQVGETPVILVMTPDGGAIRAFDPRIGGDEDPAEFYRTADGFLVDDREGARWNFQGCAPDGRCLRRIPVLRNYWFAWKKFHPETSLR